MILTRRAGLEGGWANPAQARWWVRGTRVGMMAEKLWKDYYPDKMCEKIAKKAFVFITYLFLLLLLVIMFFWLRSFL